MRFCFDLDGTLCATPGERYDRAIPLADRIKMVNSLHDNGHHITIDTARGSGNGRDWTAITAAQLDRWGVRYHVLRCGVKVPADVYVDDRSIHPNDLTT